MGLQLGDYWQLMKPRLSLLVIFSSAFGYLYAAGYDWRLSVLLGLAIGGFLITGAAVVLNQLIEKNIDARMRRTYRRPLAAKRIGDDAALTFSVIAGALGYLLLLSFTNALTAYIALLSLLAYAILYTPLKRAGEVAVWVGAVPGALPPLLGVTAHWHILTWGALGLFALQFFWQLPHFWAIAWLADEDYRRVGYRLLPRGGKCNRSTARYIAWITAFIVLLPVVMWRLMLLQSIVSMLALAALGLAFWFFSLQLYWHVERKHALRLMFASFFYLPLAQIIILLDRFWVGTIADQPLF